MHDLSQHVMIPIDKMIRGAATLPPNNKLTIRSCEANPHPNKLWNKVDFATATHMYNPLNFHEMVRPDVTLLIQLFNNSTGIEELRP